MKVAVGNDHGGLALKETVISLLRELGHDVIDLGTNSEESCDYPDYAGKVAEGVGSGAYDRGVLICGTGIGMSIAANKVKGVRAALCNEIFSARMARAHNDANILCLGARVVGAGVAAEIVRAFFETEHEAGRHARRVEKIRLLESQG